MHSLHQDNSLNIHFIPVGSCLQLITCDDASAGKSHSSRGYLKLDSLKVDSVRLRAEINHIRYGLVEADRSDGLTV
jgi:hypothetical protein